jgi:hypothetical protein
LKKELETMQVNWNYLNKIQKNLLKKKQFCLFLPNNNWKTDLSWKRRFSHF